jgi:glycosyltransferase involved in cell wall biosynthesis
MKIFFLNKGPSKLGSNRIFIKNLSDLLNKTGIETKVSNSFSSGYSIYIASKYTNLNELIEIKEKEPNSIIGLIHPSDKSSVGKKKIVLCNFFICGSRTEKDYYLKYKKKILVFPHIEIINLDLIKTKNNQINKNKIRLGYHGALEHLIEFPDELSNALEKISKEVNLELIVVYDKSLGDWKKPNIKIIEHDWSFENLIREMSSVDIGLVPSLRKNNFFRKGSLKNFFLNLTSKSPSNTSQDYLLQYKVTTNNGRALIFHELKVPVVADFAPENFIINGDSSCGYLAHSEEGWYEAIRELAFDKNKRAKVSENAFQRLNYLYDKKKVVNDFLTELKEIALSFKK